MSGGHAWFIAAAYGVAALLLAAEVLLLVRRSRAQARQGGRGASDEA
jgi:heme exporter protein CcmD